MTIGGYWEIVTNVPDPLKRLWNVRIQLPRSIYLFSKTILLISSQQKRSRYTNKSTYFQIVVIRPPPGFDPPLAKRNYIVGAQMNQATTFYFTFWLMKICWSLLKSMWSNTDDLIFTKFFSIQFQWFNISKYTWYNYEILKCHPANARKLVVCNNG